MPTSGFSSPHLKNSLYKLGVITLMVVIFWIGFEIYFSTAPQQDITISPQQVAPPNPNLHLELATQLQSRPQITEEDLNRFRPIADQQARTIQTQPELPPPTPDSATASATPEPTTTPEPTP